MNLSSARQIEIEDKKLFDKYQQKGLIKFEYKTEVIYGQLI